MKPKFLIWIATVLVTMSLPAGGQTARSEEIAANSEAAIDQLVSNLMKKTKAPGISLAIATDNQIRYAKGFGLADIENQVSVTPESRFRTASIAKSMTAVLIMSLVEDGTINLDAEVQQYCPDYPKKRWTVTSRQLLGHLGGVRHYKTRAETKSTQHFFSLKSALSTFADDPLRHEPETQFLYTTFGYNLLGAVAEGAADQKFLELIKQRVFKPAEMLHTVFDDQFAVIPRRTRGYFRATESLLQQLPADHNLKEGMIYNASLHDTSMKIPGGGLLSTTPDLVSFAIAANTGKLLKEKTLTQMWTSQKTTDGKATGYGFGWRVGRHSGRKVVSHTGGQAGTSTVLLLVPETGTSVAIMCNLQGVGLRDVAAKISNIIQPPASPTDYTKVIKRLKSAIRHEVDQKQLPAFSISLVDDNRVIWADGFGFQDAEKKKPATADTVYRVGSVSKLFTDIAVLQLVEEGKLDLDSPIQTYLPNFKPNNPYGIPLTLRQMMSHRSGLVRESPVGNYFDPLEPSLQDTVASLNKTSLVYKPETKTKYSNAAIAVVGAALEKQLRVCPETILLELQCETPV